jgi:hypothetical protein
MRILPPTNASKLMRCSRSALQRVMMSRRSCSRCRMRRRSWWFCPLFRCGVFFFSGGIGKDVLRNLFSTKDFLW